jgi:hypothetical protein
MSLINRFELNRGILFKVETVSVAAGKFVCEAQK